MQEIRRTGSNHLRADRILSICGSFKSAAPATIEYLSSISWWDYWGELQEFTRAFYLTAV
jgi:hypothetical protein